MANLKNITELPMAESADGLNLIVNDNGAAKQMPVSAVNVQADWNQNDPTKPDYVKNRPFYEVEDGEIYKIPEKYLPDSIGGDSVRGFDMGIDFDEENPRVIYGSYQEIMDIVKSGRWPMIACSMSNAFWPEEGTEDKDTWSLWNLAMASSIEHYYDDRIDIQCERLSQYYTFILYSDNSCEMVMLD